MTERNIVLCLCVCCVGLTLQSWQQIPSDEHWAPGTSWQVEALQQGSSHSWPIRAQQHINRLHDENTDSHTQVETGEHLQQAAVTLLSFLHIQVSTARPPQQTVRLRDVKQTHAASVQQTDRQICSAAAAELLPRHEAEGQRSHVTVRKLLQQLTVI